MLLVMTASVRPAKIEKLCLTDTELRLKQYCFALQFYIKCRKFNKIVFCDNSNYPYEYDAEQQMAQKRGVQLEILKFNSSYELIEKYGKGYGEGEILEYVILNSCLLKEEEYFYKVTGRLVIKNVAFLVKNTSKIARFNRNLYAEKSLDTRFWGMDKEEYTRTLMWSYKKVNDNKGRYLEMCYKRDMDAAAIKYQPLPLFPIIDGYSGTMGEKYNETKWYTKLIYDILCHYNLYNTEKGFLVVSLLYYVVLRKRKWIEVLYLYLINNTD